MTYAGMNNPAIPNYTYSTSSRHRYQLYIRQILWCDS